MDNYSFYVFTNTGVKGNLTLDDAIVEYKKTNTDRSYKALGVTKDNMFSCDLVNCNLGNDSNDRISKDYTKMDNFKDDFLVTRTVLPKLEKEFNLVK
jgi:hypothetical protein